jgi:tetratricopeptide (TPR) repeat protein
MPGGSPRAGTGGGARWRPLGWIAVALAVGVLLPRAVPAQQAEADVFVAQAILAYEEKRYDAALAALDEALRIAPQSVDALYYKGLVLTVLDRLDEAAGVLERARALAPDELEVTAQLGVVYFGLGRYDEAQPLLEAAFAKEPGRESLGYYVGFIRQRKGDQRGALQAFERSVTGDPRIEQLTRFYAGVALAALGFRERAAGEIEQALKLLPASPLTGPAERLRDRVVAPPRPERRFRAEVRVGGFYDDNVVVNPEVSDDPFIRSIRNRDQSSPGELGSLRLEYSLLKAEALDATLSYSLYATYNNDLPDFNILSNSLGLTATYQGTVRNLPYYLQLLYSYEYITLGGDEFVQRHTVTPYFTLVESERHLTAVVVRLQAKDFALDGDVPEERRDGTNVMAGFTHIVRFARDKHLLKVGYQWDREEPDGRNFAYQGHRLLAGFQYTLPWRGLRLNYDVDVHFRSYRHRNTVLPTTAPGTVKRSDTEMNHVVALALPLPGSLTLLAEFQATIADSNLDLFTFDRNFFSLSLIWSY